MCDFSLQAVASRSAEVGSKLKVTDFGTGTRGFGPSDGEKVAVCVLPGTEIAFDAPIRGYSRNPSALSTDPIYESNVGIFRQQQVLSPKGGGFEPMTLATVIVLKANLPQNSALKTYQSIQVTGYGSQQYQCKIYSITDLFTAVQLTVWDVNQNA